LTLLRRASRLGPSVEMLRLHAQIAAAQNFTSEAIDLLGAALELEPSALETKRLLGHLLCAAGRYDEAVPVLDELIAHEPENAEYLRLMSSAMSQQGRHKEALKAAIAAVRAGPDNVDYWFHAAAVASHLGYADLAIEILERSITLDSKNISVLTMLANLLNQQGRSDEALKLIEHAAALAPDDTNLQAVKLHWLTEARGSLIVTDAASNLIPPLPKSRELRTSGDSAIVIGGVSAQQITTSIGIQLRVIVALIMRALEHRAAQSRFGLISAFVEPILHIGALGFVLTTFNHGRPPIGNNLFFFYATGVMPYLMFIHVVDHSLNIFNDNRTILQVSLIRRLDIVIANSIAELIIDGTCAVIIFSTFVLGGYGSSSDRQMDAILAFFTIWVFALGFGMIGAVLNNLTPLFQKSWYTGARFMYFLSGIFYLAESIPQYYRDFLVWNPMLVGIEWFRSGFFPQYHPPWIDKPYMVTMAFAFVVAGLILEKSLRRHMKVA
jgi:capsular polysaccharide transport system permease protein